MQSTGPYEITLNGIYGIGRVTGQVCNVSGIIHSISFHDFVFHCDA